MWVDLSHHNPQGTESYTVRIYLNRRSGTIHSCYVQFFDFCILQTANKHTNTTVSKQQILRI